MRGRLLLALLAGPIFLGAGEVALSIAGWPPPFVGIGIPITVPYDVLARSWRHAELDPLLLFRLRRETRRLGVHPINSLGMVGPEAAGARSPGTLRVICLGDSTTFGIGEVPGRSYPDLLRGIFSRAFGEGRVEVLNAGLPTYTSTQCLRRFLRDLASLRPDVLVAYHGGHNEFQPSPMTVAEASARLSRPGTRFLHSSRVARAVRCAIDAILPRGAPEAKGGTVHVPLPEFRRDLATLAAECRAREIGLAFVVPPHSPEKRWTEPLSASYAAAVKEAALEGGVPSADAAALFDRFSPYPLWTEAVHPNVQGYRLLALAIYGAILESPALEPVFRRAGAGLPALRAFEALAARAEVEDPPEEEWRRLDAELRSAEGTSPELERARGIVRTRSAGAALSEDRLGELGFAEDDLARGFLRFLAGEDAEALRLVRAGRGAHPDRPGAASLEGALRASVSASGRTPEAEPAMVQAEAIRLDIAPTDPLDRALAGGASPEAVRRSPAAASAALVLLLHRDRVLGAPAAMDRRVGRAALAAARNDAGGARALLEAALAANPAEVHALAQLGSLEFAQGNEARSRALFERTVALDPAYGAAWIHLAVLAVRRGEMARARSCLDACLEARPYLSGALLLRAQLRRDGGDLAGARADLARARDLDPANPDVLRLSREVGGG